MNTIGKLVSSVAGALEFNHATLSGCVDIIVVQQEDGSLKSTPFHARFGKLKILKSKDKVVKIHVNGVEASFSMKLGGAGEAFFEDEGYKVSNSDKSVQIIDAEPIILPDAEISEVTVAVKAKPRKNLVEMLRMKHTQSNKSTASRSSESQSEESESPEKMEIENSINSKNAVKSDGLEQQLLEQEESYIQGGKSRKVRVKSLRPHSDKLKSLNLRYGANMITYTVTSSLQGTQTITGFIYFWPKDANVIVSDVDGTITKTDFLGHVLPIFGKDWSQPGIAPLFTNLRRNGYFILYLTSRPIGQSQQTKDFLQSIMQDGKMLPQGPLVMSPDRMLPSVKREIIYKRPELFKMAALKDIRSLFPANHNPFHAGFGNRDTDAISYKSVGISLEKVFIVDSRGDIQHNSESKKSYALINTMIKDLFPGIVKDEKEKLAECLADENVIHLESRRSIEENTVKIVS